MAIRSTVAQEKCKQYRSVEYELETLLPQSGQIFEKPWNRAGVIF